MKLLIDTDAFCKLGVGGLLFDSVDLLGASFAECGRLPALPYMLRRGRLRTAFGAEACDALLPTAQSMPVAIRAGETWLNKLTSVQDIDPGEAQLFAAVADSPLLVLSGDKRALRAIKDVAGFAEALHGRVVAFETMLLCLCDKLGPEEMRRRVDRLAHLDKVTQVCFSAGNTDPRGTLLSYHRSLEAELLPLTLWHHQVEHKQ